METQTEIKMDEARQGKTGIYTSRGHDVCRMCGQRLVIAANEWHGVTTFHEKFWLKLPILETK